MVVRLAHHLHDDVMKNTKNLKGLTDLEGKYKFYVFPHTPEPFRAAKAKYKEKIDSLAEQNEGKSVDNQTKIKLTGTKLFLDGVMQPDLIQLPPPSKVINHMQLYGPQISSIPIVKTEEESHLGSMFIGYVGRARTLLTVDMTYVKLHALHLFARHIMLAYNAAGEKGSCSDGEWFGDLTIKKSLELSQMTNIALFVVHIAGDQQIGPQRFDIIHLLAEDLIGKLD